MDRKTEKRVVVYVLKETYEMMRNDSRALRILSPEEVGAEIIEKHYRELLEKWRSDGQST